MHLLSPLSLLLTAAMGLTTLPGSGAQDFFQDLDLAGARARAEETDLMVMVELESPDEALTAAFDAAVWGDAEAVRRVEVEVIAVRFGGAESDRLAALWGIEERPVILLQEPDGLELRRIGPPMTARKFIRSIRLTVASRALLSEATRAMTESPDDVRVRQAYGEALISAHLFRSALVELDRAWEEGRGLESYREDRLGLVVQAVSGMVGTYPKAKNTLIRWRKRAAAVLNQPLEDADPEALEIAAMELGTLNARLDDRDHSLEMYRKLKRNPATPPRVLTVLFNRHVFQIFYDQKRFKDVLEGCGDIFAGMDEAFALYDAALERQLMGDVPPEHALLVGALRNSAMVRGSRYYETLLMTGHEERAIELADLVCARLPRGATYLSLMAAAKRSRNRDELRRLGENGIGLLTQAKDVEMVREVYDKNFKDD